jgi:hypothetical protein
MKGGGEVVVKLKIVKAQVLKARNLGSDMPRRLVGVQFEFKAR